MWDTADEGANEGKREARERMEGGKISEDKGMKRGREVEKEGRGEIGV